MKPSLRIFKNLSANFPVRSATLNHEKLKLKAIQLKKKITMKIKVPTVPITAEIYSNPNSPISPPGEIPFRASRSK